MADERPSSLAQRWTELSLQQKVSLGLAAVILAAGIAVAVMTATAARYSQLYGNLSTEDAALVVQKLKEQKIPYRLVQGGSSVEVPEERVDELRLSMAAEGLPQGGNAGFELFDKPRIGQSEFSEHLNYLRALQGELSRTISQLESVRTARVHLVLPQNRLFTEDREAPSASVVLALRGVEPSPREIKSIIHLVSSAVEGLEPTRVTVVDTRGNLLSDLPELASEGNTAFLNAQRTVETELESRVQTMLNQVLGLNKALVRVSVQLSRDRREIEREIYTPGTADGGQGVLESQHRTIETYNGGRPGNTASGAAGIPPAMWPNGAGGAGANGGNNYSREESTTSFRVSKETERREIAPGQVERISLALFVDQSVNEELVDSLKTSVGAAAGINSARGDQVEVQRITFDTSLAEAEAKAEKELARTNTFMMLGKYGGSALLVLAFLVLALTLYRRTLSPHPSRVLVTRDGQEYQMLPPAEHAVGQYAALDQTGGSHALADAHPAAQYYEESEEEAAEQEQRHGVNLRELDAKRIASVIRGLMNEE